VDPTGEFLTAFIRATQVTPPPPQQGGLATYPVTFYPGVTAAAAAAAIDLNDGRDKSGIDLALQPVTAVRLSGRLDGAAPVAATQIVRLLPAGLEVLGAGSEVAVTLANSDGTFMFPAVPAGAYTVTSGRAVGFAVFPQAGSTEMLSRPRSAGDVPATGLASSAIWIGQSTADLPPGASEYLSVSVNVGGEDVRGISLSHARPATLRCLVSFEDVKDVPTAGVLRFSAASGSPQLTGRTFGMNRETWTAAGRAPLELSGLRAGEYVLSLLNMPGLAIKSIVVNGEDYSRRPIVLENGQESSAQLVLTGRPGVVSGTVHDRQGGSSSQITVMAFPTDRQLWSNQGLTPSWTLVTRTQENGAYRLSSLREGEYYFLAVKSTANASTDPLFLERAVTFSERISIRWGDSKVVDLKVVDVR
jgi:hypothetical protein